MATESQINANRENAKASTGPQTAEGKAKSARNNTKFGLFAVNNCVQPEEKEDYESFSTALWTTLAPADPMIYPAYLPTQTAIDRARTSAQNGMRRAKADLDKMQAARKKAQPAVLQVEPNSAPVTPEKPEPEKPAPTIRTQSQPVPQPSPQPSVPESTGSPAIGNPLTSKKAAWRRPIRAYRRRSAAPALFFRLVGTNSLPSHATIVFTRAPADQNAFPKDQIKPFRGESDRLPFSPTTILQVEPISAPVTPKDPNPKSPSPQFEPNLNRFPRPAPSLLEISPRGPNAICFVSRYL